jgi:hypothetical protein
MSRQGAIVKRLVRPLALGLVPAIVAVSAGLAGADRLAWHSGRVVSLAPVDHILVIEEIGSNGTTRLVEVQIREAKIVRVSRDPEDPWAWRERPTRVFRWPAGTFVVVIGREHPLGVIDATRVEFPQSRPGARAPRR